MMQVTCSNLDRLFCLRLKLLTKNQRNNWERERERERGE